jgi:hypothetical protein
MSVMLAAALVADHDPGVVILLALQRQLLQRIAASGVKG